MALFLLLTCLSCLTITTGFVVKSNIQTDSDDPTTISGASTSSEPSLLTEPRSAITDLGIADTSEEFPLEYLYGGPSFRATLDPTFSGVPTRQVTSEDKVDTTWSEYHVSTQLDYTTAVAGSSNISTASSAVASDANIMSGRDIFAEAIDTKAPPSNIKRQKDHPVPRTGIAARGPLQTNKFFANFHLGDRHGSTFTFPYSIAWAGGKGASSSWGMACSHVEASQRVFGNEKNGASSYYLNPVGIQALVLGAADLGKDTALSMDSVTAFSTRVHLSRDSSSVPAVSFPIVQGMAYITGLYSGSVPRIQTGIFFKTVTKVTKFGKSHVMKFNFSLEDGSTWRLYAYRTRGDDLELEVVNNALAQSKKPFFGSIQIAKDPCTRGSEQALDDGAGVYPVTLKLTGTAAEDRGSYSFNYQREGHNMGNMYMYALPHHVESFDDETRDGITAVRLQSTTKGMATLIRGSRWTMVEKLPVDMHLAPWHPDKGNMTRLSDQAKGTIHTAAYKELSQNMVAQSNVDSMYFSGKALAKFATICYVANDLIGDKDLVQHGLGQLKAAFGAFAANQQKFPLMYESAWGGVVSSATYVTGNAGADFGNTYYNDHHFHYGYHILAAATIGYLDPEWMKQNKDYVNILVRDIANPSTKDKYFPLWRNFDWYHGHSWAHGLYAAADGKDQESSSEDMMHAYALKMWGRVSGNADLEARGNLQLAIIARSLQQYYLYRNDNKVQPKQFIGNRVAGILFENKVDHTTYFSADLEAIQGIHMIPILPPTPFVRVRDFVQEEWETFFSNGRVNDIGNAWKGIIYASYATVQPKLAWQFFSAPQFDPQWLDGGASLTWSLAYAAALGEL